MIPPPRAEPSQGNPNRNRVTSLLRPPNPRSRAIRTALQRQPQNTQRAVEPSLEPVGPEPEFANPPVRSSEGSITTRWSPLRLERSSLKEIEAQVKIALLQYERNKSLFQSGVIPKEKFDEPVEQLRLILGRLEGWDDELAEDSELLKLEMMKKNAEIQVAEAQLMGTSASVARNKRINERKKGIVSEEDVAKANSEDAAASASVQVKQAEAKEVELKMQQLQRRRQQIKLCVAWIRKSIPELAKGTSPF